jgi:hypothetical protein
MFDVHGLEHYFRLFFGQITAVEEGELDWN